MEKNKKKIIVKMNSTGKSILIRHLMYIGISTKDLFEKQAVLRRHLCNFLFLHQAASVRKKS